MKWYIKVIKNYANFSGRAHRTEFWMFALVNLIIAFILGFFIGILQGVTSTDQSILGTIYQLFVLIPGFAVAFRRMHDTDRSGWWSLVPIVSLVFCIQKGTEGENRFGAPPKL